MKKIKRKLKKVIRFINGDGTVFLYLTYKTCRHFYQHFDRFIYESNYKHNLKSSKHVNIFNVELGDRLNNKTIIKFDFELDDCLITMICDRGIITTQSSRSLF